MSIHRNKKRWASGGQIEEHVEFGEDRWIDSSCQLNNKTQGNGLIRAYVDCEAAWCLERKTSHLDYNWRWRRLTSNVRLLCDSVGRLQCAMRLDFLGSHGYEVRAMLGQLTDVFAQQVCRRQRCSITAHLRYYKITSNVFSSVQCVVIFSFSR